MSEQMNEYTDGLRILARIIATAHLRRLGDSEAARRLGGTKEHQLSTHLIEPSGCVSDGQAKRRHKKPTKTPKINGTGTASSTVHLRSRLAGEEHDNFADGEPAKSQGKRSDDHA